MLDDDKVGRGLRANAQERLDGGVFTAGPEPIGQDGQGHRRRSTNAVTTVDEQRARRIGAAKGDCLANLLKLSHPDAKAIVIDILERQDEVGRLGGPMEPELVSRTACRIFQGDDGLETSLVTPSLAKACDSNRSRISHWAH
ncbi:hypothetical protein [Caulobacter sp. RHG1]|uniref:hypothetical protein n=1 Tax=Caulobacter sp. (strain RHG1) TaxID=2545762 RepID=UPI001F506F2C|nr:hypothetical protein [Caulobacter sp. RHG1]